MTDTDLESAQPSPAGDDAERSDEEERRVNTAGDDAERSDEEERRVNTDGGAAPARTDMTVAEVRRYLRTWIGQATGQSPDAIGEATPMVELGLSSRDAVAMAADIEDHTGVTVSIAVAFEHPTIESLATWIVEGDPETESGDDDTDWTRTGPVERVDIAVVGLATRLPGDLNTPEQTWQALLEGRDAITDLPEGRWSEFMEEPRLAERIKNARPRGWPRGSRMPPPAAATSPTSRDSTPSSSRCPRPKPTTSTLSSG